MLSAVVILDVVLYSGNGPSFSWLLVFRAVLIGEARCRVLSPKVLSVGDRFLDRGTFSVQFFVHSREDIRNNYHYFERQSPPLPPPDIADETRGAIPLKQ